MWVLVSLIDKFFYYQIRDLFFIFKNKLKIKKLSLNKVNGSLSEIYLLN